MIQSHNNTQVKYLMKLQKKGKFRNEEGVFIAEGLKMYMEAPEEDIVVSYISESFYHEAESTGMLEGHKFEILADCIFKDISDTKTPQGVLCVIRQKKYTLDQILDNEKIAPLLIIAENLQDPGNMGTIVRTGEGAGITGMILNKDSVDLYNPKTVRSTMGSIYRVPVIYEECLTGVFSILKKRQIKTYAAHLKGQRYYTEESYGAGTAFVIGNEGKGLTEETAKATECLIKIPMSGKVESLNVGVAASILLYEAGRQRRL